MLKIKFTWPVVILLLGIVAWLVLRDSAQGSHKPARKTARSYRANGRRGRDMFVVDQHDAAGGEYDTETDRLDREAAEAMMSAAQSARPAYTVPKGSWQK